MMRRARTFTASLLPALAFVVLVANPSHAILATKASDICADGVDPCNISTVIEVPIGICSNNTSQQCSIDTDCGTGNVCNRNPWTFDFGVRDVNVNNGGQFKFGAASGSILCGDFSAVTSGAAIDASSGSDSGNVKINARRKCSMGGGSAPFCVSDGECNLDTCDRRCSGRRSRLCSANADCDAGTCSFVPDPTKPNQKKCSNLADHNISCTTDAQCKFGTCPADLSCSKIVYGSRACSVNSDCFFGTCSVGTASISMNGTITGSSESPAFIDLRAADNITTFKSINLTGTLIDSDGGELYCDANFGTVTLGGNVTATAGGAGFGGDVSLYAGTDVLVNAEVNVSGGDSGGGTTDFDAGRDVIVARSIAANSTAGGGDGGELLIAAGRDVAVTAISSASKTTFETTGHADLTGFVGDGGAHDFVADRNLTLNVNTRMIANSAATRDSLAGEIALDAGQTVTVSGDLIARAVGANGEGGAIDISSDDLINVTASGTVDVTGGSSGSGTLALSSSGDATFAGFADLTGSNGGEDGAAEIFSADTATVSGNLNISNGAGTLDVDACYVTVTSTGQLDQNATPGINTLRAEEEVRVNAGGLMRANSSGQNKILYRTAAKPPILNGTITPPPVLQIDTTMDGCVICGNGILEGGETCEDSNTTNGDGCNSGCQNEACVAASVPTPCTSQNVSDTCGTGRSCIGGFCSPLKVCEDANNCTIDTCNNAQGTCSHTAKNCADAQACTVDSCNPVDGKCANTANNAACSDGNVCSDDICSAMTGCSNPANTAPCDDGVECTTGDTCVNKVCQGTPGPGCQQCGNNVKEGTEACDDGNATFTSGEYCAAGCVLVLCGDPNNSGTITTSDAQYILRTAVGTATCTRQVCDVDNGGTIVTGDAQRVLRKSVGQQVVLNCAPPP
jgi:cysteine-rich repeat protein